MKLIKITNRILLIGTFVLYLTIFYGLLAQILLGAFQIISGCIVYYELLKVKDMAIRKIQMYFLFVLVYGMITSLILLSEVNGSYETPIYITIFAVSPMAIAIYFTVILEKLNIKTK